MQKRTVIGIDGGGTKTHALIAGFDGEVLAEVRGPGSNVQKKGVSGAAEVFMELVLKCAEKSGTSSNAIAHVVVGAAGAGRPSVRSELTSAITSLSQKNKFPLSQVTVETDARIALEAAFPGKPVIALIAGTGSIALYRTEEHGIHRAGGWGYLIGDEGSGHAIARDACTAVMRQFDGRAEKTLLTGKLLEFFGVEDPEEIIPKIYSERTEIAPFAEKVFEAVRERDRVAKQILLRNASDLADHVRILTLAHPPRHKLPVCLMGGLLDNDNEYSRIVREKIASTLPQILIQKPKFPVAFGAAILGLNAFR